MNSISSVWRIRSHLSVVDAAILVAGGDPETHDEIGEDFTGQPVLEKRTTKHRGFQVAFDALTGAIRRRELDAVIAYETERTNGYPNRIEGRAIVYLEQPIDEIKNTDPEYAFDYIQMPPGEHLHISPTPDWSQTEIAVDDLRKWLRSHGVTDGFFFQGSDDKGVIREEPSEVDPILNPNHPRFSAELAMAITAWRALEGVEVRLKSPKQVIEAWIENHSEAWLGDAPISGTATKNIASIVNWQKKGGAPTSGGN